MNTAYLVCARLQTDSPVFRWSGSAFAEYQQLAGPGAREFALIHGREHLYVLRAVDTFPTVGGTDLCTWREDGEQYVAVSNSLSADLHFRTDTIVYRFLG